jgi:hypothetical protein
MSLFRDLITNSADIASLQLFVINNIHRFHDLNNGNYTNIVAEKNDIRDFIELKGSLLENIDYSYIQCKAFISILFDFCERFGFLCTTRIENTLVKNDLHLGKRREAAKLYLLQIRNNQDYIDRFERICALIQCSIETEEDSEVKPVITFSNYVAKIIRDTSEHYIAEIKLKLHTHTTNVTYPFLQSALIQQIYQVEIDDTDSANIQIQSLIDNYLGHIGEIESDVDEQLEEILIENDTPYFAQLSNISVTFNNVRRIAVNRCSNVPANLPGRGVKPLYSEMDMYIYLKRYGNMHKSKLHSSFEIFPFHLLNSSVDIVDWGCGQGLASLVLIDYLKEQHIPLNVNKMTLIEPSDLSLKRAALHVSLATSNVSLRTVCSVFNNLAPSDVHTASTTVKIHLFSNVLDIDESIFSISNLIRLIEATQRGINYFFCISPYITDEKADRVDSFKRYFENKYESFENIFEAFNSGRLNGQYWNCNNNFNGNMNVYCRHPECGCENKWTRAISVFRVNI